MDCLEDRGENGKELDGDDGLDKVSSGDGEDGGDGDGETSQVSCNFLLLKPLSCL